MCVKPIDITVSSGSYVIITVPAMYLTKGCVNTLRFCLTKPDWVKYKTIIGNEIVYIQNGVNGENYQLEDKAGDVFYADKLLENYEYRIVFGNNGIGGVQHFLNLNTPKCARGYDPNNAAVQQPSV